jgi:hypothetical protein
MLRWSAELESEISTWPDVSCRPMFGMVAFYRARRIFAALPRTRAANTPFSFLIKLPEGTQVKRSDGRRMSRGGPGSSWVTFAMESSSDIAEALRWLGRAYEKAGRR